MPFGSECRILIAENFVPRAACEQIVQSIDPGQAFDLGVIDLVRDTEGNVDSVMTRMDKRVRDAQSQCLGGLADHINATFQNIVDDLVQPAYGIQIDYWEQPQLLIYRPGGHYDCHIDSEHPQYDRKRQILEWGRIMDRDVSVLWYLNEDFQGGELEFPRFDVVVRPSTGTIVAFPSAHQYVHGARPVTEGIRYAIVSWMAAVGTRRVFPVPPPHVRNRRTLPQGSRL